MTLFSEDLLFFAIATAFFGLVGWAWRTAKPYDLPHPLPNWIRIWFLSVQIGGVGIPLLALGWGLWQGVADLITLLGSYFLMLGLQIASESIALRWFRSIVFVMVPYLYLPYRLWQLYQGLIHPESSDPSWLQPLLLGEIGLWTVTYGLDVSQLPRLVQWPISPPAPLPQTDESPHSP